MTVVPLTKELRKELSLGKDITGLVVQNVDETAKAYDKGVRAGDVISEAGQQKLRVVSDFEARIAEAKEAGRKSLLLLIRRAGDPRFVALSVED